jgi:hypothetical protein
MSYDSTTFTITYTIGGTTYNLDGYDPTTGLTILFGGDDGWGMPDIDHIAERGALQNGETPIDFRFLPRVINLNLFVQADNYVDLLQARQKLGTIFGVSNTEGTLTITYSSTVGATTTTYSRSLDVLVRGGLEYGSFDYRDYNLDATVELRASDPMWYDPAEASLISTQVVTGTPTPIPTLIPTTFGGASISQITNITYSGTAVEYPKFTIVVGATNITDLNILNQTTGKILTFPILFAGRTYIVDLTYGYKTIVNDLGENCIGLLSSSSNLATWAIDPAVGVNAIQVTSSTANSETSVTMEYYNRYTVL